MIAAAGYSFRQFYLKGPGAMTPTAVAACVANGIAVFANWEYGFPRYVSGSAQGLRSPRCRTARHRSSPSISTGTSRITSAIRPPVPGRGFRELPGAGGAGIFTIGHLNGASNTGFAITGLPDGSAQFLALGLDGSIHHNIRSGNGTRQGWTPIAGANGAARFSGPAFGIAGLPDGSAQILAVGLDYNLYHNGRYANGAWQRFRLLGLGTQWTVAGSLPDGSLQVLAIGNDRNVYHNIRSTNRTWQGFSAVRGAFGASTFHGTYPGMAGFPWG